MEPTRIPPASSLPASGLESVRQSDPQHPVKQVQQEDQVQFSAESEQVARLKSEMDVENHKIIFGIGCRHRQTEQDLKSK